DQSAAMLLHACHVVASLILYFIQCNATSMLYRNFVQRTRYLLGVAFLLQPLVLCSCDFQATLELFEISSELTQSGISLPAAMPQSCRSWVRSVAWQKNFGNAIGWNSDVASLQPCQRG